VFPSAIEQVATDEAGALVHIAVPTFTNKPDAPLSRAVGRWEAVLALHPHESLVVSAMQFGQPTLLARHRLANWRGSHVVDRTSWPASLREAVREFFVRERELGRVQLLKPFRPGRPTPTGTLVALKPDGVWTAPCVVVAKPGSVAGAVRVCHDLSRRGVAVRSGTGTGGVAGSIPSVNDDIDLDPVQPAELARWEDIAQRLRYLAGLYPDTPLYGAREDLASFFRQHPLRRGGMSMHAQSTPDGEWVVHTRATFGARQQVHLCGAPLWTVLDFVEAQYGIVAHAFVDDLIFTGRLADVRRAVQLVRGLAEALGYQFNDAKATGPTQVLEVLGVHCDLAEGRVSLTAGRRHKLMAACQGLLVAARGGSSVSVERLQQFTGLCVFIAGVIPFARAHLTELWALIYAPNGQRATEVRPEHKRRLTADAVAAVEWWLAVAEGRNVPTSSLYVSVRPGHGELRVVRIRTDAAGCFGFGATVVTDRQGFFVQGTWPDHMVGASSNPLELIASTIAVAAAVGEGLLSGCVCVLETDSFVTHTVFRKEGSSSPLARCLCTLLAELQERARFYLRSHHVAGRVNIAADRLSRGIASPLFMRHPEWVSDWVQWTLPACLLELGTASSGKLLTPPRPVRHLVPLPPGFVTWARTLADALQLVYKATWPCCATTPVPFIPYHPAWQTRPRGPDGQRMPQ
jgi:hypothetical protein